jgi:putative phage-type endonuclease
MNDITASDVPTICGECPYATRRSVLFKKALRLVGTDTPATLHGRKFEPIAIERFCNKTGAVIEYPGYVKHSVYNWFGGTIDGLATMPDGTKCIIEVKCPISRPIKDEVPIQYVGQIQSYLEIFGLSYALLVQYKQATSRSPEKLQITKVPRDEKYFRSRLPCLSRFRQDLLMWSAYTEKVVCVIQRAWRGYRKRREAVTGFMIARLRCASLVGKISGFIARKKVIQESQQTSALSNPFSYGTCYVQSFTPTPRARYSKKHEINII